MKIIQGDLVETAKDQDKREVERLERYRKEKEKRDKPKMSSLNDYIAEY